MLTLLADQPECLWDDALPVEVKELPEDLAALDVLFQITSCCGRSWSAGARSSRRPVGWC